MTNRDGAILTVAPDGQVRVHSLAQTQKYASALHLETQAEASERVTRSLRRQSHI